MSTTKNHLNLRLDPDVVAADHRRGHRFIDLPELALVNGAPIRVMHDDPRSGGSIGSFRLPIERDCFWSPIPFGEIR